jgi:hypothetical protein
MKLTYTHARGNERYIAIPGEFGAEYEVMVDTATYVPASDEGVAYFACTCSCTCRRGCSYCEDRIDDAWDCEGDLAIEMAREVFGDAVVVSAICAAVEAA